MYHEIWVHLVILQSITVKFLSYSCVTMLLIFRWCCTTPNFNSLLQTPHHSNDIIFIWIPSVLKHYSFTKPMLIGVSLTPIIQKIILKKVESL